MVKRLFKLFISHSYATVAIPLLVVYQWNSAGSILIDDIDLGVVEAGGEQVFSATIRNQTAQDFHIIRVHACCRSIVTNYPPVLAARASGVISGTIAAPYQPGQFTTVVTVYGEQSGLRSIVFKVQAFAVAGDR